MLKWFFRYRCYMYCFSVLLTMHTAKKMTRSYIGSGHVHNRKCWVFFSIFHYYHFFFFFTNKSMSVKYKKRYVMKKNEY